MGDKLDDLHNGNLNCSTDNEQLIECDIDETNALGKDAKCMQCKQILSSCINIKDPVYSATNPDLILIQPNTSETKGYCLPTKIITNTCTRRRGGKWILTHNEENSNNEKYLTYTFECFCSTPNFFQNDITNGNDCTKFIGCRNGKLKNDKTWNTYEDMECDCQTNLYEAESGNANVPPKCTLLNVYRRTYTKENPAPFEILKDEFLDNGYKFLLAQTNEKISLPNPCSFDLTTKTFIKGIGKVVLDEATKKIAYCVSLSPNYKTTILNDDYLLGNNGKYANVLFRIRREDKETEIHNDPDDYNNNYKKGIMYETLRKNSNLNILAGERLPYRNFTFYLPYLESDSFNMGNSLGQNYNLFPTIPLNRQKFAMIYVYDAEIPNYNISERNLIIGNVIKYVPTFNSIGVDSRYRVYNGCIPCLNIMEYPYWNAIRNMPLMWPSPPANGFNNAVGKTGIMGPLSDIRENEPRFLVDYGFHFMFDGSLEPYSTLFTGKDIILLFNYFYI